MEEINYFKDMLNSIPYYRKIILLCFIIKKDNSILREFGLTDGFIEKLYNDCEKILENDINEYFSHIKKLRRVNY